MKTESREHIEISRIKNSKTSKNYGNILSIRKYGLWVR